MTRNIFGAHLAVTFLVLFFFHEPALSSEEDWFDVDAGYSLRASYGAFDDGASAKSALFIAPLPFDAEMALNYGSLKADQDSEDSYFVSLRTDADALFSFGLSAETIDADTGYDVDEFQVDMTIAMGAWETQLRVSRADLQLAATGIGDPVLAQRVRDLGLLDATRDGLGFSLTYFQPRWALRLSLDDYELERDGELVRLDRDAVLAGLSNEQRRDLLLYLTERSDQRAFLSLYRSVLFANYSYAQQVSVAADYTLGVDAYFWDSHANTYAIGFVHVDHIHQQADRIQGYVSGDFLLGSHFSFGLLFSGEDEDDSVYSELSIGYSW